MAAPFSGATYCGRRTGRWSGDNDRTASSCRRRTPVPRVTLAEGEKYVGPPASILAIIMRIDGVPRLVPIAPAWPAIGPLVMTDG
jgi:hypothetical protein